MAGHTPGPLQAAADPFDNQDHKVIVEVPGSTGFLGTEVARCEHNWNDHAAGDHRISWAEAEANARLYAASPELLEALEGLVIAVTYADPPKDFGTRLEPNLCHEARVPTEFVTHARTAIAKAKGES